MTQIATQTGQVPDLAKHASDCCPAPKWMALLDDRGIPMPRRVVTAQIVKEQAGIAANFVLVRDYQTRNDVVLPDNLEVDLADGNVFRAIPRCEAAPVTHCSEPAKLAVFVDDTWEITLTTNQSGETVRRLFDLPPDVELLRDHESPFDEPIAGDEAANFRDGPVFRTQRVKVTIKVNNNPVSFHKRRVNGLEIKQTAITQGVKIPLDGVLYRVKADGSLGASIGDAEKITLKDCEEFRCVTPDDNS